MFKFKPTPIGKTDPDRNYPKLEFFKQNATYSEKSL